MEQTQQPFIKGFKFRIYPNVQQKELFEKTFGCCRFIYNKLLAETKAEYQAYLELRDTSNVIELKKPSTSGFTLAAKAALIKQQLEYNWLNEVSSVALQQSAIHLGDAFTRFFRTKKGYPKFKKKHSSQSFSLMKSAFRFNEGQLYIAKSKQYIKIDYSRDLPSEPDSLTISKSSTGKYYISFSCKYIPKKTFGSGTIGIDLGLKSLVILSTGEKITNPKHIHKSHKKLRRLQQSLSRKQKGSKNKEKARLAVALQHERIANCRKNHLHQLTRRLINENQVIGLESLVVRNMVKNRKLSKHIYDASWNMITQQLMYKAKESQHVTIVFADQFFPSSHLCNVTGEQLDRKLKLSEREWSCPYCQQVHDRDINAAMNLRNEAIRAYKMFPSNKVTGCIIFSDKSWKHEVH